MLKNKIPNQTKVDVVTLNKKGITDFALERNKLLVAAKNDWVFFVDSDEIISNKLQREIDERIESGRCSSFRVSRKNYFLGQYVGSDKIVRLGKKDSGKWKRAVHEIWVTNGKVRELESFLIHNTAKNLYDYIAKIDYYSTLHAKENSAEGKKSNIIKIISLPFIKFWVEYYKSRNVVFSIMQSFHSFLGWSKEWINQNK
jgi:glycosyltransferase involved in cell wall biosynthesis